MSLLCAWGVLSAERTFGREVSPTLPCGKGIVFVADGSGDLEAAATNLQTVIHEAGLSLCVQRVAWSHGWYRPLSDLVKHGHHRQQGVQLAASVLAYREAHPGDRVFLVGHSSGAAVVLAAAEHLPDGSVDRIILLAPAVSASYDLCPALRCAREGIDSFYSKRDPILSTFIVLLGTADRRWEPAAGWVGFRPRPGCAEECPCCKLRQHAWSTCQGKTGYRGGHYGCRSTGHLREQVLPLLICTSAPGEVVVPAPTGPACSPHDERK